MTRLAYFTPRTRALRVALACVALPLLCSLVDAQTVTITGVPTPPATVTINIPYTVNVSATPASGFFVYSVSALSTAGNASGPTGSWVSKGSYSAFSHTCGATVSHTFNVVNQASGYYYWKGLDLEFHCTDGNVPGTYNGNDYIGYYYTEDTGGN